MNNDTVLFTFAAVLLNRVTGETDLREGVARNDQQFFTALGNLGDWDVVQLRNTGRAN